MQHASTNKATHSKQAAANIFHNEVERVFTWSFNMHVGIHAGPATLLARSSEQDHLSGRHN